MARTCCYTPPVSKVLLAPSVLSANFTRLGQSVTAAQEAGCDYLHLDVMDGHFVPNLTFGPGIVSAIKSVSTVPLDVHLMIEQPERFVERFAEAGADIITVHAEATSHLHRLLSQVRESGARVGLALNPLTPLTVLEGALPYLDLALIMSVNPGLGGQEFIQATTLRLETVRRMRDRSNPNCLIEVDGGINKDTAPLAVAAGAEVLVAGSAVFGSMGDVATNIATLREAVARVTDQAGELRG